MRIKQTKNCLCGESNKQKTSINFNLSKELFEGIGSVAQGQPTKIKASGLRGDLVVAHGIFPDKRIVLVDCAVFGFLFRR